VAARAKLQRKPEHKADVKADTDKPEWGVLKAERYWQAPAWDVPWGWPTALGGMVAWAASFLLVGLLSVPLAMNAFHFKSLDGLNALQESQLALLDQVRGRGWRGRGLKRCAQPHSPESGRSRPR